MAGKILERDEMGRITKKSLTSEEAKALSESKRGNGAANKRNDIEILLNEAGYENPGDAPKVLQVVAETIADRGPRSIQAAVQYRQLTSRQETKSVGNVRPGDICPVCNQYVMVGLQVTDEQMGEVLEIE